MMPFYRLSIAYREAIWGMLRAIAAGRGLDAGTYAKQAVTYGRTLSKREGGRDEIKRLYAWALDHTPNKVAR
jgi:hypothetical protein